MNKQRIHYLLTQYLESRITEVELHELGAVLLDEPGNDLLQTAFQDIIAHTAPAAVYSETDWENIYRDIISIKETPVIDMGHKKAKRFSFRRIAVAASIIGFIGVGAYFLFFNKTAPQTETVKTGSLPIAAPKEIRAMITLSDGRTVALDSINNGVLVMQGNMKVLKNADGGIVYSGDAGAGEFNTLINPRGSKVVNLMLSDGTKVWLNAESSLRYPVAFTGNERKVSITGEAYFEVMHDEKKPFTVSKGETQIQVLGTHFNVNAYDDEAEMKVTLIEGSVKVNKRNASGLLKPGQQALVADEVKIINKADIEQVMAWKDGVFRFKNTNIGEIMRQVGRWYDVNIEYKGNFTDLNFGGSVSRQADVSELLKRLEATEAVRFAVEGRKITVVQ